MCWFIENVGTISDCVTAFTAISALIAALFAWRLSKRTFRYQIINELLKEYRSKEMGTSIRRLHEYFQSCGSIQDTLILRYIEDYKIQKQADDSIHNHRRAVSLFYQQVAILADKDRYIRKTAYEIWKRKDLEIIETIITPIEVRALRAILHQQPISDESNYPRHVKRMLTFYRRAPKE